ncbi:MAG: hypothetical protein ACT6XY_19875 [Phreatobacter sp.]|jgi:hypothetical protein|uniref:hypothetical protein n=1 Tax=Phreatobacter sp. TaxID=1966341 RepID=UPI0040367FFC
MTPTFDAAVLDTLFPGLGPIPPASRAGPDVASVLGRHGGVLEAIAATAGGRETFAAADAARRAHVLAEAERAAPAPFQALVLAVSALYHASAPVVEAYGWVSRPPQPQGFTVGAPGDEAEADGMLERVRARRQIWRG